MNQGFAACRANEYLCFWGSDDWFPAPTVLEDLVASLDKSFLEGLCPDLLVCSGCYIDSSSGIRARLANFTKPGILCMSEFRKFLFMGSTPPHQASLIGPNIRAKLNCYTSGFRLSADLDYFLRLSSYSGFVVECIDIEMVHMSDGGISGLQTQRRLHEVSHAYSLAFGWRWLFPFVLRYARRLASRLMSNS